MENKNGKFLFRNNMLDIVINCKQINYFEGKVMAYQIKGRNINI